MTETDASKRPLQMPPKFLPYLDKWRIYLLFKDLMEDLLIHQPRDHLKHMKVFLAQIADIQKDIDKIVLLVSPELDIDVVKLAKELIKDLGVIVISRRCVMDRLEKHDKYEPGCISTDLISQVTKNLCLKSPVTSCGWLMFDHPCTVREARYLQQDGVLPTVTLVLSPPPPAVPRAENPYTPARNFFQQDFEGLTYVYRATRKDVIVYPDEDITQIGARCFNAVRACAAGAQGPGQGYKVVGNPGVYRVVLIGPLGSNRRTQGRLLAQSLGLVYLDAEELYKEASKRNDDIGKSMRKFGINNKMKADIIERRLLMKDCLDQGWVLRGYPQSGAEFEHLDNMPTPPNRIIFLNLNREACKERAVKSALAMCPGRHEEGLDAKHHMGYDDEELENELDFYFYDALAELHAGAGLTAVQIDCNDKTTDEIQTKILAAVMQAPAYNIEPSAPVRGEHVRVD